MPGGSGVCILLWDSPRVTSAFAIGFPLLLGARPCSTMSSIRLPMELGDSPWDKEEISSTAWVNSERLRAARSLFRNLPQFASAKICGANTRTRCRRVSEWVWGGVCKGAFIRESERE